MNFKKNFSFWVVAVLLATSGALSWVLYFKEYRQKDTVDIKQFPRTLGEWTSEDLPISEDEYAILETRNVLARRYTSRDSRQVYLLLVYSQNNRKVSHPPEICYTGSGVSILDNTKVKIEIDEPRATIEANRLLLELSGAKQVSCYWFKVGESYTSNYWKQQGMIALKTLSSQPHSNALIRVSSDLLNNDQAQAMQNVTDFTNLILPYLSEYLP